jgi:hypothetical protein
MVITPLPRRNSVMLRGDRDLPISTRLPGQDWGDGTRTMALIDNSARQRRGTRDLRRHPQDLRCRLSKQFLAALASDPAILKRTSYGCGLGQRLPSYRRLRWDDRLARTRLMDGGFPADLAVHWAWVPITVKSAASISAPRRGLRAGPPG